MFDSNSPDSRCQLSFKICCSCRCVVLSYAGLAILSGVFVLHWKFCDSSQKSHTIAAEATAAAAVGVGEAGGLGIAAVVVISRSSWSNTRWAAAAAAAAELPAKAQAPAMLTAPKQTTYRCRCQCSMATTKVRSLLSVEDVTSIPGITFLVLPVRGLGM